jgi:hypothetical protein
MDQVEALWMGVGPYRPEDEVAVEEMYERARRARLFAGSWWMDQERSEETADKPGWPWCLRERALTALSGSWK